MSSHRHNHRDHTFVTVTTRHFVTRLDATFNAKINFTTFNTPWVKVIACSDFAFFIFKFGFNFFDAL
jgi:hypothetical protein